jgi:hypothetical protein
MRAGRFTEAQVTSILIALEVTVCAVAVAVIRFI